MDRGDLPWRLQLFADLLIPAVHRGNADTAQPPRPPRPSLSICCHHAEDPKVAAWVLDVRAEIAIHVAIRHSITFLMTCLILLGSCSGTVPSSAASATPALTRYYPTATIQAGNWWSTSSSVPARASSLSALPLRHELLAIKAHAALCSGASQHWGSCRHGHVTFSEGEPVRLVHTVHMDYTLKS